MFKELDPTADRMYIILKGQVNLAVTKTKHKFKVLEHTDDPSLEKREIENRQLFNPNTASSLQTKFPAYKNKFTGNNLIQNVKL